MEKRNSYLELYTLFSKTKNKATVVLWTVTFNYCVLRFFVITILRHRIAPGTIPMASSLKRDAWGIQDETENPFSLATKAKISWGRPLGKRVLEAQPYIPLSPQISNPMS